MRWGVLAVLVVGVACSRSGFDTRTTAPPPRPGDRSTAGGDSAQGDPAGDPIAAGDPIQPATLVVTTTDDENDIVSLLWQAMFEHITYIAVDDILDLENETDVPAEFGQDFMNFVDFDMHDLEDGEEANQRANEMAKEIQAKINQEDASLFGITPEEKNALLRRAIGCPLDV